MNKHSSKKELRDVNQLTRFFVDLVTGNPITEDISPIADKKKNPVVIEPGRLKGKARNSRSK
jgi:hypothetical protein